MIERPGTRMSIPDRSDLYGGVGLLLALVLFGPTVKSFPGVWSRFGMGHGWLVAGLVVWLLFRNRGLFIKRETPSLPLLTALAGASVLWFLAYVAHIQALHQLAFVVTLAVWGLAVFRRPASKPILLAAATFLVALPIWDFLAPVLRKITTVASSNLVSLLGIPNRIEGDMIHISAGSFLISDGCSGLAYFLAALTTGVLYSFVLAPRRGIALAVVGLAVGIAIVGNWVRVATLILVGHASQMQSSLIGSHGGLGWLIFAIGLLPFFILAGRLVDTDNSSRRSDQLGSGLEERFQAATSSNPDEHRSSGASWLAFSTAVAIVGPMLYFSLGTIPRTEREVLMPEGSSLSVGWAAESLPAARAFGWHPAYHSADLHETASFTNGRVRVHTDRFFFRDQGPGAKLIGYPNRVAPAEMVLNERVVGPIRSLEVRWVRQAIILTPKGKVLVWYWFSVGERHTFSQVHAKLLEIPSFILRRSGSELIAYSAECEHDNCLDALFALASFMGIDTPPSDPPFEGETMMQREST